MKKKVIIAVVVVLMLAVLGGAIYFFTSSGNKIANGTYKAVGCEEYPNATIIVTDDSLQFEDIDLNDYYKEPLLVMRERCKNYTEEEVAEFMDLNKHFVQNVFVTDETNLTIIKKGTFEYIYVYGTGYLFGVVLFYNSLDKTIEVGCTTSDTIRIVFKKE
ncbi:MAG: hypothetical protein K6F92_08570 [Lachnospiraceae bacterium]|nr:hypothetical protein [Lachnospiraceae bacterium]